MGVLAPIVAAFAGLGAMGAPAALGIGAVGTLMVPAVGGVVMNPSKAWRTPFSGPIKGDAVLVEIYGADLFVKGDDKSANMKFDGWFGRKPDCYVRFQHGSQKGQTQVEGNTFSPRFYETRKLAYDKKKGFEFQVWESDVLSKDRIVGRCWVSANKAKAAMKSGTPVLAKLGAGIGRLKVLFTGPLAYADRQGNLTGVGETQTRKKMNDLYSQVHAQEVAGTTMDPDG